MDSTAPDATAQEVLGELSSLLGDLADDLVVIGGVAVNFWKKPRYTHDVDFNVRADRQLMATITERLLGAGYRITRNQAPGATSGPDFVQFKRTSPEPEHIVEFQAAKTDYQELTIARGKWLADDQAFAVATPEDLIVLKLIANRSQDISDCIELAKLPGLDWGYVRHWCEIWAVGDRVDGLLSAVEQEQARVADLFQEDQ